MSVCTPIGARKSGATFSVTASFETGRRRDSLRRQRHRREQRRYSSGHGDRSADPDGPFFGPGHQRAKNQRSRAGPTRKGARIIFPVATGVMPYMHRGDEPHRVPAVASDISGTLL